MKLIPAATLYKCELPYGKNLGIILEENRFVDLSSIEAERAGFEVMFNESFIAVFEGGYAFKVRYDEKILPNSVVVSAANKRIAELEALQSRKLGKKERKEIKDEEYFTLVQKALVSTKMITCFYITEEKLLIVPTASKKLADIVMVRLLKAVGAIKATTLYVDGIKNSTTSKLLAYLEEDTNLFGDFDVSGHVKLKGLSGASQLTVKETDLSDAKDALLEALNKGSQVEEIGLENKDVFFRLSSDFRIRGVEFLSEPDGEDSEDELREFSVTASIQTMLFVNMSNMLLKLFEYKEPETDNDTDVI
jgi:recombination associated protein RdgC